MFQVEALIVVIILVSYILTAHIIAVKRIKFLHESVVAILMGIVTALFIKYIFNEDVHFDSELFFNFLLPPIIFAAGYNLHRNHFFDNFWLISYHGIICTILTFVILSAFALFMNETSLVQQKMGQDEILLLTATLCATDTVAALTLIKEKEYPILNSVLFGEGIFNDAVSILIFRSVKKYLSEDGGFSNLSMTISLRLCVDFIYLLMMSLIVGVLVGALSSLLFKYCDSLINHPVKETSLILLLGYASYLVSESLHLSGILSLFCCGIIMAVYTYPNISEEAQHGTQLAFDTIGYLVEAFVFAYLGITTLQVDYNQIPWSFSLLLLLSVILARFVTVFVLPCCYFLMNKQFKLNTQELFVVWYSGLIRGVIAFALCITIKTANSEIIQGCVLVIVLITTIFGSILLDSFINLIGMKRADPELNQINEFMLSQTSETDTSVSYYKSIGEQKSKLKKGLWGGIEQNFVRPIFQKPKTNQVSEISMHAM
ncbi:unnamed protein product [Paramecium pentaurelia]|uniref:Cation/H+ exchanger transmembrane domain-containing protein n=1 Tax=Paramecium pentaurelia TaxID=43138 RepID=A0A8S1VEQ2_9CILI|nr:unnamed protein product [Paramecium pentaurelia]